MGFEWDEEKEQKNIEKHGISFLTASLVFCDPNRLELYDEMHSVEEDRFITIGMVGNILAVVYTMRGDRHRIVSARVADEGEKRRYHDGY